MEPSFSARSSAAPHRRSLPTAFLILLIGSVSGPLWADWYVDVCPGGQKYACPCPQGPFATWAEAQKFADAENGRNGGCFTVSGSDDASSTSSDNSGGLSSLNQTAYKLGEAIGDQIRADDAAAKEKADEAERLRIQKELEEVEQRRLKYEASRADLLGHLRGTTSGSGDGLREVGSSGDGSGLRDVGSGEGFMQGPPPKKPKAHHLHNYKYHLAAPTPTVQYTPTPKEKDTPTPNGGDDQEVQHADVNKDGVHLTGKADGKFRDLLSAENTNDYDVEITVWTTDEIHCAHGLRSPITLKAGTSVELGWVEDTTREEPWSYQARMNVDKK